MSAANDAIVNVYLTDDTSAPWTDPTKMRGSRMGIPSGFQETFQIALADLEVGVTNKIEDGAQLIINIPKDWQLVTPLNSFSGYNNPPTINIYPDGSAQIVGTLTNDLASGGKIISFDAIAPVVTCDKMYVMHVLANGKTEPNDRPIGPVAEIVLQVVPAGACS
jgi:hypothetical protein